MNQSEKLYLLAYKMDIRFTYKQLFEHLFRNKDGLQLYTIYRRFNLSPSQVVTFVNKYNDLGIISITDDSTVMLTLKGRNNLSQVISHLFQDNNFTDTTYLSIRLHTPIDKYSPYIPSDIIINQL